MVRIDTVVENYPQRTAVVRNKLEGGEPEDCGGPRNDSSGGKGRFQKVESELVQPKVLLYLLWQFTS